MAGKRWSEISEADIINYMSTIANYSSATMALKLVAIRRFFDYLCSFYSLKRNPAKYIRPAKQKKIIPHIVKMEDVKNVITNCSYAPLAAAMSLMAFSGLRISEVLELKSSMVTAHEDVILILGKGKKERYVFVNDKTAALIMSLSKTNDNHIFSMYDDRSLRYAVWSEFNKYNIMCSPHMLRHSFATHAVDAGMDIETLKNILGHQDIKTTQIYLHTSRSAAAMKYNHIFNN